MATGASRPLRSALLLLQFRCATIAKGRLLLSILPIWSIGGEPGCARRRWRPASAPRNPTRSSVEAMTSPPRLIKESISRWCMLDAAEDHRCIAGSFNLARRLPSSLDFTGRTAMALCSSHIRSPEPELSGHYNTLFSRRIAPAPATLKLKSYGNQCDLQGLFGEILCNCETAINHISADLGSKALRASDKSSLSSFSKMVTWSGLTGSLKAIKVKRGIKLLKPLLPFVDCSCLLVTAFATAERANPRS
ncbi:hypothetical protein VPH35_065838 [Triticum aestivum]